MTALPFTVKLAWNGNTVTEATTTSAMAFEIVRAFAVGNFVKPQFYPSLAAILRIEPGETFEDEHSDEQRDKPGTGVAYYSITRL